MSNDLTNLKPIDYAVNQLKIEKVLAEQCSAYPESARHDTAQKIMQSLYGIWIEDSEEHTERRIHHKPNRNEYLAKEKTDGN